jgi:thiamine pyrophosphokinase
MKALIVASGSPPTAELLRKHGDADLVIAADGGIEILKKSGIIPDFLIGDFDSASGTTVRGYDGTKTQVVRFAVEKNDTDGMIALKLAIERGADSVVLLGGLGRRSDHALANIMLLGYAHARGIAMVIEDEFCEITLASGNIILQGQIGQTVSILPWMSAATVTSDDSLHYPLQGLYLAQDDPVGISNILQKPETRLFIQGMALLFKIKQDG